jgi:hypothetical protein
LSQRQVILRSLMAPITANIKWVGVISDLSSWIRGTCGDSEIVSFHLANGSSDFNSDCIFELPDSKFGGYVWIRFSQIRTVSVPLGNLSQAEPMHLSALKIFDLCTKNFRKFFFSKLCLLLDLGTLVNIDIRPMKLGFLPRKSMLLSSKMQSELKSNHPLARYVDFCRSRNSYVAPTDRLISILIAYSSSATSIS